MLTLSRSDDTIQYLEIIKTEKRQDDVIFYTHAFQNMLIICTWPAH